MLIRWLRSSDLSSPTVEVRELSRSTKSILVCCICRYWYNSSLAINTRFHLCTSAFPNVSREQDLHPWRRVFAIQDGAAGHRVPGRSTQLLVARSRASVPAHHRPQLCDHAGHPHVSRNQGRWCWKQRVTFLPPHVLIFRPVCLPRPILFSAFHAVKTAVVHSLYHHT